MRCVEVHDKEVDEAFAVAHHMSMLPHSIQGVTPIMHSHCRLHIAQPCDRAADRATCLVYT
jgi:hypothetical protein